jgi:hypothetical protein
MKVFNSITVTTLLFSLILISSCKSGIDRNDALEILKKTYGNEVKLTRDFRSGDYDHGAYYKEGQMFKGETFLQDNGYRTFFLTEYTPPSQSWIPCGFYTYNFTDKAKPFIVSANGSVSKISVGTFSIKDIINLRKVSESEYEVEFSTAIELNDFGKAFNMQAFVSRNQYTMKEESQTFKQKLLKYDDGWKIDSDEIKKTKKELTLPE